MFSFKKKNKSNDSIQILKKALLPKEQNEPVFTEKVNKMTLNFRSKKEDKNPNFWNEISHEEVVIEKQAKTINEYHQFKYSKEKIPNIQIHFHVSNHHSNSLDSIQKTFRVA